MEVVVVSCSDWNFENSACRYRKEGGGEVPSDRLYANSLHPVSQTTAPKQHNTMAATLRRSLAWFKGIVRVF